MKKPLLLVFFFGFCLHPAIFPQSGGQNLKEIFLDGEYFFLYEDYEEALYSYNTLYKQGFADNANINYRIGLCYLNVPGEKYRSIPFLEMASQHVTSKYSEGSFKETKAPLDAEFFLGTAYRINNQLDKAVEAYEKYTKMIDPKEKIAIKLSDKQIEACKLAQEMMKKPLIIKTTLLDRPINTSSKDYFPALSGDESVLLYNSSQKFYQAVFFSKKVNDKWDAPVNITSDLESDGDQFVSSVSYDGNTLFLRKEDNFQADILTSKYENGKWIKSKPLNKNINTKFWEGNACMTKDGKTLYFSSNRSGGKGALDIYQSQRQPDGEWGPAVNLGEKINSEFNEDAPMITEDGKRLYFASQGHNTMGGYDIFYSEMDDNGSWSIPVNLGYPINTTDDDIYYYPLKNGKIAYRSMYSGTGIGNQDIFRMQIDPGTETTKEQPSKLLVVQTEGNKNPDPPQERILLPVVENAIAQAPSAEEEKESPTFAGSHSSVKPAATMPAAERTVTGSIFFTYNSSLLSTNAKKELDHLYNILLNYPEVSMVFIGHTDAIGSDFYNQVLSEKRANAAKAYLVQRGIDKKRIKVEGRGKKEFIAVNSNVDGTDNPRGRTFNRRVDIKVPGAAVETIIIKEVLIPDTLQVKK